MQAVKRWDKKAPKMAVNTMTPKQKAKSQMDMNRYKLEEMRVHPASKQYLSLEYKGRQRKWKKKCRRRVKKLNAVIMQEKYLAVM